MQFKHYELNGAHIAAELCNAPQLDADSVEAIMRDHDVDRYRTPAGAIPAIEQWTNELRTVFETPSPDRRRTIVNDLMAAAGCVPRLVSHDEIPTHLHFDGPGLGHAERVRALTAGGLAVAVAVLGENRLGMCARPGCERVYIDVSRSGRRHYCSVKCANTTRVQRHRARHE